MNNTNHYIANKIYRFIGRSMQFVVHLFFNRMLLISMQNSIETPNSIQFNELDNIFWPNQSTLQF